MRHRFQLWAKEDRDRRVVVLLCVSVGVLLCACLGLGLGWHQAPKRLTVYVPPDLSQAVVQSVTTIPEHYVYVFAYLVWQELHYWPTQQMDRQGQYAYVANLERLRAYLTPTFHGLLQQESRTLQQQGQLNRTRWMEGIQGALFKADKVRLLAPGEWLVYLDMRLTETAQQWTVKNTTVRYPLRVIQRNVSPTHNPYGLMLAGFAQAPTRLMETEADA